MMDCKWVTRLKRLTIIHILLAIAFFVSGFVINSIQFVLWWTLRPLNIVLFRKINCYLCYAVWCQVTFIIEWWSGSIIRLHGAKDLHDNIGKEHALIMMNHTYEMDGLLTWVVGDHARILGNAKVLAKKALKYAPIIGWTWYFAEIFYLERDWNKDQLVLSRQFDSLLDWPDPFWLLVYPEGTRFTKKKHETSMEFARSKGLPEYKYHLVPRTKGFAWLRQNTKGKMNFVYNVQLGIDSSCRDKASLSALLRGEPLLCDIYIERLEIKNIPESNEEIHDWMIKVFKEKDDMFAHYMETNEFFTEEEKKKRGITVVPLGKRLWPMVNVAFWLTLVHGYILKAMISSILSGSYFMPGLFCAVVLAAAYGLGTMVNLTRLDKASAYGEKMAA